MLSIESLTHVYANGVRALGRTVIRVAADADRGDGFGPVVGGLEDVYFSTLASSRKAA